LEVAGLEKTGLEKTGLEKTGLEKTGLEKTGLEKTGEWCVVNRVTSKTFGSWSAQLLILLVVALGFATAGTNAWGQADTGRINGTIKDSSGAVIPGVTVVATRAETGDTTTATTDKTGVFLFPGLRAGTYNISATLAGFSEETLQGIVLVDAGAISEQILMKAGASEEISVVTGNVDTVNTQTGEVSHVIDGDTVRDLALNGRNYIDLLGTLPGSVQAGLGDAIAETTSNSTTNVNLNGGRATANGLYIDGFINKDIGSNAAQFNNVGIDFIEHVRVQTSSFSAQYGSSAGPSVNVVTRSGANSIHGSAFEYIRNNYLDAVSYFSYTGSTLGTHTPVRNHLRYNDFGFALGGPILHDKLFFFIGTEWKLIATITPSVPLSIPLIQELQGNELSGTTVGVSNLQCPTKVVAGVTIPGVPIGTTNIANCISPFGHALANEYAYAASQAYFYNGLLANCTTNPCNGNASYELPNPYRNHQYTARLDWTINSRQTAYGRWFADTHTTTNPTGGGSLPVAEYHDEAPANNVLLSHTLVVSPRAVNEISFGALFSSTNYQPAGTEWLRGTYGYSYQPFYVNSSKVGAPSVSIYGKTGLGNVAGETRYHPSYFQLQDIYTYSRGKHSLKFGALLGRNRADTNGRPNFLGGAAFQAQLGSSGNQVTDALLGNFTDYVESPTDVFGQYRLTQAAAFVDDVWRAASKLSINFGLRWEHETPWVTVQDNTSDFYPSLYDPTKEVSVSTAGVVTVGAGQDVNNGLRRAGSGVPKDQVFRVPNANAASVTLVPTSGSRGFYQGQNVFQPRFGAAYDLFGNGQTAFRGGGGLFYDTPQASAAFSTLILPPYVPTVNIEQGNMDNIASYANNIYPFGAMYTLDPKFQRTYVYQYNFGVQQQMGKSMFFQLNYVGAEGRHLLRSPDINGVDPSVEDCVVEAFTNAGATVPVIDYMRQFSGATLPLIASGVSSTTGLPVSVPLKNSTSCNQLPAVSSNGYGGYGGYDAIYQWRSDVDYNYNSLQANINRRVGKGRFTLTYTLAKNLSTGSADVDTDHILLYSKTYNYGPTTFDRRNVVTSTYIVQAGPLARQNRIVREALASWFMSGNFRYQGGTYLTASGTDEAGTASRANFCGYPVQYAHKPYAWYYVSDPSSPTTPGWTNVIGAGTAEFTAPTVYAPTSIHWTGGVASSPCGGRYTTGVGNAPIGNILGPHLVNLDISLRKTFELSERYRLTVNFDTFNVFNHPNFGNPGLNVNSTTIGGAGGSVNVPLYGSYEGISSVGRPRNLSAGARLNF
jgi:hypothetical protein